MSDELHVRPMADLIEHTMGEDGTECPCGPTADPVMREDGSCGWVIVHHSLDGREASEND